MLIDVNTIDNIAHVCHEANRAWCKALGDDSQPAWEDAPDWQKSSALDGVRTLLDHPDAGPEASHENWRLYKEEDGWIYGEVKSPEKKEHPCMVPFADLPPEQQTKDRIFHGIVHAMSDRLPVGAA